MPSLSIGLTILIFLPCLALGETPLGQSWPRITDGLLQNGIDKVGNFDIKKFNDDSRSITWRQSHVLPPAGIAGNRHSAYFNSDGKTVFEVTLSDNLPKDEASSLPNLELHEALSVRGYDDHSYTLSSALDTLANIKDPVAQKALSVTYGENLFNNLAMAGGGGNSVSGGGDLSALFIKGQLLHSVMVSGRPISRDFLVDYPTINFEPVYQDDVRYVAMKYQFRNLSSLRTYGFIPGALLKRSGQTIYEEQVTVFIPMARWTKLSLRPALLKEIANRVLSIYPVRDSDKTVRYAPEACRSRHIESDFPRAADQGVRQIQQLRAGFLLGCDTEFNNLTLIDPKLPVGDQPEEANDFLFTCQVGDKSEGRVYPLHSRRGIRALMSFNASADDETEINAQFIPDPVSGAINSIYLVFRASPDGKFTRLRGDSKDSGATAAVTARIGSHLVKASCSRRNR